MRRARLLWLVGVGCSGDNGDSDGGDLAGECPPEVHLEAMICLESTGEVVVGTGYTSEAVGTIDGVLTESGPPTNLLGSMPVGSFAECDDAERILRIEDANGETWTVGWSVGGEVDALPDALTVGEDVTLTYEFRYAGYSVDQNVVVSDVDGARFVFAGSGLDPSLLEGLTVNFGYRNECLAVIDEREWAESPVSFTGTTTLVLYSGESGEVAVDDRVMEVVVPVSAYLTDCMDGCGAYQWVGWD